MFNRKKQKILRLESKIRSLHRDIDHIRQHNAHMAKTVEDRHKRSVKKLVTWYKQRLERQLELLKGVNND